MKFNYKYYYDEIKRGGLTLLYVPKMYRDYKMVSAYVKNSNEPYALEFVPNEFKDTKLINLAMHSGCEILKYIEIEKYEKRFILKCLSKDPDGFKYIPKHLITSEYIWKMIKSLTDDNETDTILSKIPPELITKEIIKAAIRVDPYNIIDTDEYTYQDALYVVKVEPLLFYQIKEEFYTEEILLYALDYDFYYGWLPEKFNNLDFHTKLHERYPEEEYYKKRYRNFFIKEL